MSKKAKICFIFVLNCYEYVYAFTKDILDGSA